MTFTHSQLEAAVRAVGRSGEPFTSAALRAHLGMKTEERRALTRFNDALRTYCKTQGDRLVQLGKNRYCLLESGERDEAVEERPRLPLRVTVRITRMPMAAAPKSPAFAFGAWVARWLRSALGLTRGERRRAALVARLR
jgi:hypothetical protein